MAEARRAANRATIARHVPLSFNTAGPCIRGRHYMLPPERRLHDVLRLIEDHRFFSLNAGRQTGKTTSARWMVEHYNAGERFAAVWVDVQDARELSDPSQAFALVLDDLDRAVRRDLPELPLPSGPARALEPARSSIRRYLHDVAARSTRPLVLLIDEADGLVGEAMVSLLTQLRQGYIEREELPFAASVVLIGQRQVRDYVLREEDRRAAAWLGTTSPFNITAEATTLGAFTEAEVGELLGQHTAATGQRFSPAAAARIHDLGQGHPWLTNALADQIVRRDVPDPTVEVTGAHVDAAKETIILERRSHIDSLAARLREPRVQRIIEPMLMGGRTPDDVLDDDFAYVLGLGLIRQRAGRYEIANPIYREVVPRVLSHTQQLQIANEPAWYVRPDGSLDLPRLMADWQLFWREDGHLAAAGFAYREAGPHLMLMAFLQRIVNGGGKILREYGLGRGALDLLVEWRGERHAIEVKLRRDTTTEARALEQVAGYLDGLGLSEGWLVLFDLREGQSWDERIQTREVEHAGKRVWIVGC
jgi:type II secretory pathway predicted ATPase ExeA